MKFALGKKAKFISDRSGFAFPFREKVKEWNGLLVGKDEWEEKHPQLEPLRVPPDPQAIKGARPEPNLDQERNIEWGFNPVGGPSDDGLTPNRLKMTGSVGAVTVVTT